MERREVVGQFQQQKVIWVWRPRVGGEPWAIFSNRVSGGPGGSRTEIINSAFGMVERTRAAVGELKIN